MISMPDRKYILTRMLMPSSIAIIGASANLSKVNGRPLGHLLDKGYTGRIMPVNPKYSEIEGIACYPEVSALPEVADLAIVAVPAAQVAGQVEALGRYGVRAAVIFSSGFGELGDAGKQEEQVLVQIARRYDMVLCGPNCLGFINVFDRVYATFSQYADGNTNAGPIAFVTQSGAFGTAIAALINQRGLGLGYFINTGNQADLTFSELMLAVVDDPRVKVMAGYLEGVSDGDALMRLAFRCHELGKPLVITKVGRKASGARAAASHTGALAVEDVVFDAVLRQYGVLRARNEEQMLDMLEALSQPHTARGKGLGIVTQSGGAAVMMADRAEEIGLEVPTLAMKTEQHLQQIMPAFGATGNPVDVTGQFVAHPELLRESVIAMMDDPVIDIGIVWLQLMTGHVDTLVRIFAEIQSRVTKPWFVCWVAAPDEAIRQLRDLDIVVYGAGERAVEAASSLARFYLYQKRLNWQSTLDPAPEDSVPQQVHDGVQETIQANVWLSAMGVPMAPAWLAREEDEAVRIWRSGNRPVALKIESPDIVHKTEIGGVTLALDNEGDVRHAYRALLKRATRSVPQARLRGVLVQPMCQGHVELVIGVRRDPALGMLVMVGLGGIMVEIMKDVAFRRAPFDVQEALAMLAELRGNSILDGVRGRPAVDREVIATLLANVSRWAIAMQSNLSELDLNPVLVGDAGPIVVDCLMMFESDRRQ